MAKNKADKEETLTEEKSTNHVTESDINSYKHGKVMNFKFNCALEEEIEKQDLAKNIDLDALEEVLDNNSQLVKKSMHCQTKNLIDRIQKRRIKSSQNKHFLSQL